MSGSSARVAESSLFSFRYSYFLLMAAGSFLTAIKSLVFAKLLTVAEFGYLTLFTVLVSYGATLLPMGLVNGLNREFPVALGRGDEARAVQLRNGVVTLVGTLFTVLLVPWVLVALWLGRDDPQQRTVMLFAAVCVAVTVLYQIAALELRGRQLLVPFSWIHLIQAVATILLGSLFTLNWGLMGAMMGLASGYLVSLLLAYTRHLHPFRPQRLAWARIAPLLEVGVPLLASLFVLNLIMSLDRLFIAQRFGAHELGLYQFGALMVSVGQIAAGIIGQWLGPQVMVIHGRGGDPRRSFLAVLKVMGGLLAAALLLYYPFTRIIDWLIDAYFPRYAEALPLLRVFYFGAACIAINQGGHILVALKRQRLTLAGTVAVFMAMLCGYLVAQRLAAPLMAYAWLFVAGQAGIVLLNILFSVHSLRRHAGLGER